MKPILLALLVLTLAGCAASWEGLPLFGDTTVSCASTLTGTTATVSGLNIMAIASAAIPMMAPAMGMPGLPIPVATPKVTP